MLYRGKMVGLKKDELEKSEVLKANSVYTIMGFERGEARVILKNTENEIIVNESELDVENLLFMTVEEKMKLHEATRIAPSEEEIDTALRVMQFFSRNKLLYKERLAVDEVDTILKFYGYEIFRSNGSGTGYTKEVLGRSFKEFK